MEHRALQNGRDNTGCVRCEGGDVRSLSDRKWVKCRGWDSAIRWSTRAHSLLWLTDYHVESTSFFAFLNGCAIELRDEAARLFWTASDLCLDVLLFSIIFLC